MEDKTKYYPFIILLLIVIISITPYLILTTNAYLTIHDNLDGEFVYYHNLKMNNLLFSFNGNIIIPNVMNGLPRHYYHSEFSFIRLLFYLFPSFWAYIVNLTIVRAIGFLGMYLLLRDYICKNCNIYFVIIISLMFAFMPYYSLYGISVSGQAILLWAFLNIFNNKLRFYSYLIFVFFPFYSHFALVAPFLILSIFITGIHLYGIKIFKSEFILAIITLCVFYIIANYITIQNFLFPHDISHRTEWVAKAPSLKKSIIDFFSIIIKNQYHSSSFIAIPIYILLVLNLIKSKNNNILLLLTFYIIIIAGFYAVYPYIKFYFGNKFHILISFQFDRFTFLIPFIWFIILSLAVYKIKNKINIIYIYLLISIQFLFIIINNKELIYNYAKLTFANKTEKLKTLAPGFNEFYAKNQFEKIDSIISLPKKDYRVVSLGIHPSIAQYNGFYTLDSYQNNYPLSYKYKFQKIIQPELDKDKSLKDYFINWGSRCYLFSSELFSTCYVNCYKNTKVSIELNINTSALKKLGGKYILSAVNIKNYKKLNLIHLTTISDNNSLWDIYLYQVK